MSRTYRRRGERHDYAWVLRDYRSFGGALVPFLIDPRSTEGRRAIARFHSDAFWTLRSTASALVSANLRSPAAHAKRKAASPLARRSELRSPLRRSTSAQGDLELVVNAYYLRVPMAASSCPRTSRPLSSFANAMRKRQRPLLFSAHSLPT